MIHIDEAKQNFTDLSMNPYPDRGIVLGTSADGKPIPSFNGFPKLMVKWIDRETFEAKTIIVNKNV